MLPRAAAIVALILLALPSVASQTGSVRVLADRLPDPVEGPAAAAIGKYVYAFGGYSGVVNGQKFWSDKIVRLDASTGALTLMAGKLPQARHAAGAAAVQGNIYLFGGFGCFEESSSFCARVVKYDPAADKTTFMNARFPKGFYYMAAASAGDMVYIVGGESHLGRAKDIWRYDPARDNLTQMEANLPVGLSMASAVWVASNLFIFGGDDPDSHARDWILQYDPAADRAIELPTTLPRKNFGMSTVYDGRFVWLLGGEDYPTELDSIVRFDPTNNAVALLQAQLPSGRFRTAAAWAEGAAFLFGGEIQDQDETKSVRLNEVVRFEPAHEAEAEPTKEIKSPGRGGLPGPAVPLVLLGLASMALALARRRR